MKLTTIALAAAFALSGTFAFAHTVRHESSARTYRDAAPPVVLHPNYGNPNGNPDGPTTLSGTGSSALGKVTTLEAARRTSFGRNVAMMRKQTAISDKRLQVHVHRF